MKTIRPLIGVILFFVAAITNFYLGFFVGRNFVICIIAGILFSVGMFIELRMWMKQRKIKD